MTLPTDDYRRLRTKAPTELHTGLDGFVDGVVGRFHRPPVYGRGWEDMAFRVHRDAGALSDLSDARLKERIRAHRHLFRRGDRSVREALPDALTCLVEAAHRTVGLRPYPVQIQGAVGLYNACLVEMATGEGKSLTACLPAILAGWTGRPCHIVTVNDYLARRDAAEMRRLYDFCQVSVGCVAQEMEPAERRENHARGVVYTTSKELCADFLRDRIRLGILHNPSRLVIRELLAPRARASQGLVLRGLDTAIVDEADSVLIDEAVTPLIISRQLENRPLVDASVEAQSLARRLQRDRDYAVDWKYKEVRLTRQGRERVAGLARTLPGLWKGKSRSEEMVLQALNAREFYLLDKQYVLMDDKVVIVDEFTGRIMPNRTWRQGLHQAVEAKEGLAVTNPTETLARLSFQRFFRFFRKLSGMTGTGREAAGEFWQIYRLPFYPVPTNRPCIRQEMPDAVFADEDAKWRAVVESIQEVTRAGQPVLVGTRSVAASERLAAMLESRGLYYNLLNAVRHVEEARIVAAAGESGRITIATNMAGRGTDIKLGRGVAGLGGLYVIATERHESGRIDRQLFGRCARQGDPGTCQAFVCPEDELLRRFLPEAARRRLVHAVTSGMPGTAFLTRKGVSMAQKAAQRMAFAQRRTVLRMDDWLEESLSFTGPASVF